MIRALLLFIFLLVGTAEARPVRFIQKLVPTNYQLYRSGAIGDGQATWVNDFKAPPNIATEYSKWLKWKDYRVAQFEKKAPKERANTYYFVPSSAGGSDAAACTYAAPCATRTKCASLITANGGNTRCRFHADYVWDDATDIVITANNNTIDCYKSGASLRDCTPGAEAQPLFNAFAVKYLDASNPWTLAAGNRYTVAETNDIAWVRKVNDRLGDTLGQNLVRVASSAACEALSNSWFWGANVLHINLGGTDPNTLDLEAVISNTANGIEFQGDGNRVEFIRADGYGMHRTNTATQAQPFTSRAGGNKANYFKNLEAYYSSSHVVAHNWNSTGGKSMWNGIIAGYPKYNAAGNNIFNTYSALGEHETWWLDTTAQYGTLKSSDWSYTTLFQRGHGFLSHTNSASYDHSMYVVFNTSLPNSHTPLLSIGGSGTNAVNPSPVTDFSQYKSFMVKASQPATGNAITTPAFEWFKNQIIYGSRFAMKQTSAGVGAWTNYYPDNTWVINSDFEMNQAAVASNFTALYNTLTADNKVNFLHSSIRIINAAVDGGISFGLDFDNIFGTTTVAGAGTSRNSTMTNSILSIINSGTSTFMRLSLTNSATALKNNRFYDTDQNAGFDAGYDLGTSQSTLSAAYDLTSQAALLNAGNKEIQCSHDINGRRRDGSPDIGPVEF